MNIIKSEGEYKFFNDAEIINELPVGNYTLVQNMFKKTLSLKMVEDFKTPDPYYNIEDKLYNLIDISFNTNNKNLGILLSGLKGNGKSVTAKMIAKRCNLPVILIKEKVYSDLDLFGFLSGIKMPACILIDEFEKIFDMYGENDSFHSQNSFLSYMDGAMTDHYKKMFVFTSNGEVSDFLINRPSRIKFHKSFNILDENLINMVIEKELKNKDYEQDLRNNIDVNFNLDLLMTIIADINMLDMPFSNFKDVYNYNPSLYKYTLYIEIMDDEDMENIENINALDESESVKNEGLDIVEIDGKKWKVQTELTSSKYSHDTKWIGSYRIISCIKNELFSMRYLAGGGKEIIAVFHDKV